MVRPLVALALLAALTAGAEPARVKVGVFLRNAEAINLEQNAYNLSFTLWFKWRGEADAVKGLKLTNVLDGWALTWQPVFDEPLTLPDGSRYQRYLVEGRFFNKFHLESFPFDAQRLVLELEELRLDADALVLEPDEASSARAGLTLPGWRVGPVFQEVALSRLPLGQGEAKGYAKYRFGLEVQRPASLFFLTLAPPLLLVLLCCWAVFFLRAQHVDARVGTVITALLTIVFLDLAYTDDIPYLAGVVLIDQLFNYSYLLLTAMLFACVAVVRWKDAAAEVVGKEPARAAALEARIVRLDRLALRAFPPVYLVGALLILWLGAR